MVSEFQAGPCEQPVHAGHHDSRSTEECVLGCLYGKPAELTVPSQESGQVAVLCKHAHAMNMLCFTARIQVGLGLTKPRPGAPKKVGEEDIAPAMTSGYLILSHADSCPPVTAQGVTV